MQPITHDYFEDVFLNRHSIRKYKPNQPISREVMTKIIKMTSQTPSSLNLQPWHFVVVDSPEKKAALAPYFAYNPQQCETSSAMVFIFGDLEAVSRTDFILDEAVKAGKMPEEVKLRQSKMIKDIYQNYTDEELQITTVFDGGLVAMSFMLAARYFGYDTCPIGGFDKQHIHQALDIDETRYLPLLALSIGVADETGHDSYRLSPSDITTFL
ncbi:nitroreductase family protein [Vagococcus humatus]|uniref:Nitroreductase family protein n=1 Tax=Vagococcus humatus TaxID=1889241 RepID=A0A429Z7L4_9ENTE|nr:nitroreductase family protein [Vagococcus humatus]RST89666.1 nitroreductase family protein [Vagococcus humatus]